MKLRSLIEEYLQQARMMQVATSRENQPWACTVYFATDEDLNLYWISLPTRRHSEEIRRNEKVAGTVVLPHTPGDEVRGIQFEGIAKELQGTEAREGLQYYAQRYGMDESAIEKILTGENPHVCYRITPKSFVLFDEVNFPDDSRQEYRVQ